MIKNGCLEFDPCPCPNFKFWPVSRCELLVIGRISQYDPQRKAMHANRAAASRANSRRPSDRRIRIVVLQFGRGTPELPPTPVPHLTRKANGFCPSLFPPKFHKKIPKIARIEGTYTFSKASFLESMFDFGGVKKPKFLQFFFGGVDESLLTVNQ